MLGERPAYRTDVANDGPRSRTKSVRQRGPSSAPGHWGTGRGGHCATRQYVAQWRPAVAQWRLNWGQSTSAPPLTSNGREGGRCVHGGKGHYHPMHPGAPASRVPRPLDKAAPLPGGGSPAATEHSAGEGGGGTPGRLTPRRHRQGAGSAAADRAAGWGRPACSRPCRILLHRWASGLWRGRLWLPKSATISPAPFLLAQFPVTAVG